jgi:hypothetical protein
VIGESVNTSNEGISCEAKPLNVDEPATAGSSVNVHQQSGVTATKFYGVRKRLQSLNVCERNIVPTLKRRRVLPSRYSD